MHSEQFKRAGHVFESMWQVMPIVVLPIAFATFVMLVRFAKKRENITETLPLIFLQFIIVMIWLGSGFYWLYTLLYPNEIGYSNF